MRLSPPTYEAIVQGIIARMVTLGRLTDVGDASVFRHLASAVARAVDQANYQTLAVPQTFSIDTAQGDDLDARAQEIQPGTLKRLPGAFATGFVVFSRQATQGAVRIDAGTTVSDASGNLFTTGEAGLIADDSAAQIPGHAVGQDSAPVAITALSAGTQANVAQNTLTTFVKRPVGVDAVTNPSATNNGSVRESDDAFAARLKAYVASLSRSTAQALETAVLGAQDPDTGQQILFSDVQEDPARPGYVTLYVDDGSGTAESVTPIAGESVTYGLSGPPVNAAAGGETRLTLNRCPVKTADPVTLTSSLRGVLTQGTAYTLNGASGLLVFDPPLALGESVTADYTAFTGIVALGQKIVDGDPNDRQTYPGVRAAGVQVQVLCPLVIAQPVEVYLTLADGYDAQSVRQNVQAALLNAINALPVAHNILRAALYQAMMAQPGVVNAIITAPASDVAVGPGQIARCLAGNITVN